MAPKGDLLERKLEASVKRLLSDARDADVDLKIDALKVAIVWFATSRKLAGPKTDTGAILDEMRKMVESNG